MSRTDAGSARAIPSEVARLVARVRPASAADPPAVQEHLDALTKPPGSLGRLEDAALRLAVVYGDPPPRLRECVVFVLAADHGVSRRDVSAYPREVTAQMCRNLATGGAAVCALARSAGVEVVVADLGVDAGLEDVPGLLDRKVRRGTQDLSEGPAMTPEETAAAMRAGAGLVAERRPPPDIVAMGEMGIGNSTSAAALVVALTGADPSGVVGPGTGVSGPALDRKRKAVSAGLERLGSGGVGDGAARAFAALREVGGLEIAGLVGVALEAAARGTAVVVDGFIATAAALVARRMCPAVGGYLFASHRSAEPGHDVALRALGLQPLLDLDLRLGEGTGAVLALPLLEGAGSVLRDMATFDSAGVSGPADAAPPRSSVRTGGEADPGGGS